MATVQNGIAVEDILYGNEDSVAGLTTVVYWGYHDDVAVWPKPGSNPSTYVDVVKADAAVTMKTGCKMGKIIVTFDENDLKFKLAGSIGSKGYKQDLTLYRAGQTAEFNGFTSLVKNKRLFFIIPDKNDKMYLLGSELIPCMASEGEGQLGNTIEAKNGNSITFTSESRIPLLEYNFAVPLTPAVAP